MKNNTRRKFLQNIACLSIACMDSPVQIFKYQPESIDWSSIKSKFLVEDYPILHLNSGSAGIMSKNVLRKYIEYLTLINSHAPYEILHNWEEQIRHNLHRLANHINATQGYLYLLRNSTEALNHILWGRQWNKSDEIIHATCDYPLMKNTLEQLISSKKIKLKTINHGRLKDISDDEIVKNYEKQIGKKTKLIVLTYITHREGHILPVKKICAMAKSYGIEVLIDAAHAVGQINHNVDEIGCDYYTSSLHKWLNAPLGSGILYVKRDRLRDLTPPISYPIHRETEANKFEYLGTRAFQNGMALGHAIDDLESMGIDQKQKRLHTLKNYWIDKIKSERNLEVITDTNRSCAIASVKVPISLNRVSQILKDDFKIHVKKSGYIDERFLRISPNVFTLESDLDYFVESLKSACK